MFPHAATCIDLLGGKETGAVEVEIRRELMLGEMVDGLGVACRNMGIAEVFSDHRAVFGLDQSIVVGASRAGFGELLDVELGQHFGDAAVDVFRAVIGMEAAHNDGKGVNQGLEHGQQEVFGDALDRADELELGDLVDQIDMIEPLDAVEIALIDRVDAQEAGLAFRTGLAALADLYRGGTGLGELPPQAFVSRRLAQVVEVAVGDAGQALVTVVAEAVIGALAQLAGGRPGQGAVQGVDFGQQAHVLLGVTAGKGLGRSPAPIADRTVLDELTNQAGQLRARLARDLRQVLPQQALVGLAKPGVAEPRRSSVASHS